MAWNLVYRPSQTTGLPCIGNVRVTGPRQAATLSLQPDRMCRHMESLSVTTSKALNRGVQTTIFLRGRTVIEPPHPVSTTRDYDTGNSDCLKSSRVFGPRWSAYSITTAWTSIRRTRLSPTLGVMPVTGSISESMAPPCPSRRVSTEVSKLYAAATTR
jgi:hypothetical protein